MASFERPRVRTDGPGGPDIKQGARIACLDCRTAKIRCSAPTDGKVPCSRCSRHGKECVFEKHRRGRKPGRATSHFAGNALSSRSDVGRDQDNASYRAHQHSQSVTDRRYIDYAPYRREGSEIAVNYSSGQGYQRLPESAHHHQQQQQVHARYPSASSIGLLNSSSSQHEKTSTWSPSPGSTQAARFPSTALRSLSPGRSPYDQQMQLNHHRSHSSQSHSSGVRESNSQEQLYHKAPVNYATSPHNHPVSSPTLPSHSVPPPPPLSPRRMGGSKGNSSFGLTLGPIVPSFGIPINNTSGLSQSPTGGLSSRVGGSHLSLATPLNMPRFTFADHQLTPGGLIPASTLAPNGTPTKTWLDYPSPGSRATFSPSHHSSLSSMPVPPLDTTSSAPFWPGGPVSSGGSGLYKKKGESDYFSGAVAPHYSFTRESRTDEHDPKRSSSRDRSGGEKKPRLDRLEEAEDAIRMVRGNTQEFDEEEEAEEVDELGEDEMGGHHHDDVLSTPLSLLAHASDAALALKESKGLPERRDSIGKRAGAATMGLVSPPVPKLGPSRRWFDSDRLPHLGPHLPAVSSLSPVLSRPRDRESPTSTSVMAPPFGPLTRRNIPPRTVSTPPGLGAIGRSRSYTTVENVVHKSVPIMSPPQKQTEERAARPVVTDVERRAEVLGEGVLTPRRQEDGEMNNPLAPSTLDHDAWEYRDGRARTRKSVSSGPGTSLSDGSAKLSMQSGDQKKTPSSPRPGSRKSSIANAAGTAAKAEGDEGPSEETEAAAPPKRWKVMRMRADEEGGKILAKELDAESDESETLGASHRDFFSLSIYHSKMDNEIDLDPVQRGLIELREVEKLFDIFFARINPLLNLFDPFLHSVTYVRNRSALLTTVIAALAARLSDQGRDAELAVRLERYWRHELLPEVLLGGYKSVELSQAFLVLSLYHKPTNRLADDRSWQYLGFALRIATEIGVNRTTRPTDSVRENEQVRRRMRNRVRLWISLFLVDRSLSFQTGRSWTVSEDEMITQSNMWHIEAFALPEDTRLVSTMRLTRLAGEYFAALDGIAHESRRRSQGSLEAARSPFKWKEDVHTLQYCLEKALIDLERWRDVWCSGALEDRPDGSQTSAVAQTLEQWKSGAKWRYHYYRLSLCTRVLQCLEGIQSFEIAEAQAGEKPDRIELIREEVGGRVHKLSLDAWQSSMDMMQSLLDKAGQIDIAPAPNQTAIMSIYAALAALRLTRSTHRLGSSAVPDAEATLVRCRALTQVLIQAGNTPKHRNGAAASYGTYLDGILNVWESDVIRNASSSPEVSMADASAFAEETQQQQHQPLPPTSPAKTNTAPPHFKEAEGKMSPALDNAKAVALLSESIIPLPTPFKEAAPMVMQQQQFFQHPSVGDEIWGNAASQPPTPMVDGGIGSNPEAMDRMWDYLTTYSDPSNGFPLSLWQPHTAWATTVNRTPSAAAPTL